jgi:hypothetical protein
MVDLAPSSKIGVRYLRSETEVTVDEKTGQSRTRDRVFFCQPGSAQIAQTSEYVSLLSKNKELWAVLGPHYEAWKQNNAIPENGTPLAAWSGVTPQEAEILKSFSIPTVEELSVLQDSVMARIPLPNIRAKRDMAQRYLASSDTRKTEQALAEKDQQIADLQAKLENLAEMIADKLDAAEQPKRGPGRPPKQAVAVE